MAEQNVVGQITPDPTETPSSEKPKTRLTKALPTDRLSWDKQLLLLRCYAIASATSDGKPVPASELAKLSQLNISSVGLNNTFFADAGLLQKVGSGYVPVPEVVSFERAWQFNADTAGQKLAPALRRSWAGMALVPKLAARPMSDEEAIGELAEACSGGPEQRAQLRTLLDYLVLAALVEREGGMVRQGRLARDDGQASRTEDTSMIAPVVNQTGQPGTMRVATTFAGASGAAGGINLAVNINVDMTEMGNWPPQVVTAFMTGLAQVITAKAAAEASTTR